MSGMPDNFGNTEHKDRLIETLQHRLIKPSAISSKLSLAKQLEKLTSTATAFKLTYQEV
jgi:hypothetical protein